MYKRLLFTLLILVISSSCLFSQEVKESKATKYHEKALQYYHASAYKEALEELNKAIKADGNHIESWLLAGDVQALKGEYSKAIESYKKAIEIDSNFFVPAYYILANLYFQEERYAESVTCYQKYLKYPDASDVEKYKSTRGLNTALFRIDAMKRPVPFKPVNLGPAVNTSGYEFVNYISPDRLRLFYTRRMMEGDRLDEQFYYSINRADTSWSASIDLGPPINTQGDEGAMALSPDGQLLFYSACGRPDGYGSCDLYVSRLEGDQWSEPVNLGPVVNTPGWESQPSFSSDGRTLYFVSNRPGGMGSSDVWITTLSDEGNWSRPVNAGNIINTPEAERGPFIHPDGTTLYFSSKGHIGMGQGDIFYSVMQEGVWSKPVNLGYPINSKEDEVTMIVDNEGKVAYYSSAKDEGFGLQDIYAFNLPGNVRPAKVSYMKGFIYDSITRSPLQARFRLLNLSTGDTIVTSVSNPGDGSFLLCIPAGYNYALNVEKQGYLFYSAHFEMKEKADYINPFRKDIPMKPIREGESIVLRNVFFETDSFNLLPESTTELDQLLKLLAKNSRMHIQISGHTDNVGTDEYNRVLSEKRARSVYDYLVAAGIDRNRLTYKGYGRSKPVAANESPEGRALNRRTEMMVTQMN